MEINEKNKKTFMIIMIILTISLVVVGTYALYNTGIIFGELNTINTRSGVQVKYTEGINAINITETMTDQEGIASDYFSFSIDATSISKNDLAYYIYLTPENTNNISEEQVKIYLTEVANTNATEETVVLEPTTISTLTKVNVTTSGVIEDDSYSNRLALQNWFEFGDNEKVTKFYRLRMWMNESSLTDANITTEDTQGNGTDTNVSIRGSYRYGVKVNVYSNDSIPKIELLTASEQLINKVGTDGLVAITHPADNTLQLGATTDITEYRYQGANPNNYVNFNGTDGDYRIIGVFPTDDGTGNITNRIKLIKTTNYGNNYWNNSTNNNKWGEANLKTTLNNTYYNSLTNKELIDNVKYYLGGYNQYASGTYTKETMYQYERKISGSTYYYSGNPTSWTGRIGLMYVSDYMYGTAECNQSSGYDYDATTCKTTNWLYLGSYEWTITEYSSYSRRAFYVYSDGFVNSYGDVGGSSFGVRPVQYLISEAVIIDGTGTIDNPYTFGSVE